MIIQFMDFQFILEYIKKVEKMIQNQFEARKRIYEKFYGRKSSPRISADILFGMFKGKELMIINRENKVFKIMIKSSERVPLKDKSIQMLTTNYTPRKIKNLNTIWEMARVAEEIVIFEDFLRVFNLLENKIKKEYMKPDIRGFKRVAIPVIKKDRYGNIKMIKAGIGFCNGRKLEKLVQEYGKDIEHTLRMSESLMRFMANITREKNAELFNEFLLRYYEFSMLADKKIEEDEKLYLNYIG